MQEEIKKLKDTIDKQEIRIDTLTVLVKQLSDTKLKVSAREIINHEVQFLGKAYDKSGSLIPEINA